jgi:hypothetical protein
MNHAQKQLVLSGAAVAAILGLAAVQEISKSGLNCKEEIKSFERRGRWVTMKSRICE